MKLTVFFHNDFDGIAAAAIFAKFIGRLEGVGFESIELRAVDYDIRRSWTSQKLNPSSAVLDFLFHPDARWWFDHHQTAFMFQSDTKRPYIESRFMYWNTRFHSCPSLLLSHFKKYYPSIWGGLQTEFRYLVKWSNIIDGARYRSAADLFSYENDFMNVNRTLAIERSEEYRYEIVRALYSGAVSDLIDSEGFQKALATAKSQDADAADTISRIIEVRNRVAFFDQSDYSFPLQRYIAYYLYPDLRYRVAIYRREEKYSVSVNHNAWINEKNLINIGHLCSQFGGGGRNDVGAVLSDSHVEASSIAYKLRRFLEASLSKQLSLLSPDSQPANGTSR